MLRGSFVLRWANPPSAGGSRPGPGGRHVVALPLDPRHLPWADVAVLVRRNWRVFRDRHGAGPRPIAPDHSQGPGRQPLEALGATMFPAACHPLPPGLLRRLSKMAAVNLAPNGVVPVRGGLPKLPRMSGGDSNGGGGGPNDRPGACPCTVPPSPPTDTKNLLSASDLQRYQGGITPSCGSQ
jgi:hypothetical protein